MMNGAEMHYAEEIRTTEMEKNKRINQLLKVNLATSSFVQRCIKGNRFHNNNYEN